MFCSSIFKQESTDSLYDHSTEIEAYPGSADIDDTCRCMLSKTKNRSDSMLEKAFYWVLTFLSKPKSTVYGL